jgi:uncharacterized protein (TIGR00251 family)
VKSTELEVKVVPGASRSGIVGWLGEALKIRVTAPPERGKANAAVAEILAGALGIARRNVRVTRGKTSPRKIVEIDGLSADEVRARLAPSEP